MEANVHFYRHRLPFPTPGASRSTRSVWQSFLSIQTDSPTVAEEATATENSRPAV